MIKVIIFFSFICSLYSIDISADSFESNSKISKFVGNVVLSKGDSNITSNKIEVILSKSRKPIKYKATGKVVVNLAMNDKRYIGKSDTLTYLPKVKKFILDGNASLLEVHSANKVEGQKIVLDELNSLYQIKGNSKNRVKLTYGVEDDNKSKF